MHKECDGVTRREFISGAAVAAVAGSAAVRTSAAVTLPKRKLGRTGLDVSAIVYGSEFFDSNAVGIVERLIEAGVNYIDTAPMYKRGGVEQTLAPVLKRHADKLTVATKWYPKKAGANGKVDCTKEDFLASFDASCQRMQVDGVDLIQVHDCRDPETVANPGAHEAFLELKDKGRVKWYGISTHMRQADCVRKATELGWYDTCLVAWNFMSTSDETEALKAAAKSGMGVLTMKTCKPLTDHKDKWWPKIAHDKVTNLKGDNLFQSSIRWSLSHGFVSGLAVCMKNYDEVAQNLEAAMIAESA